ncbi:pilus assembly protein [Sulfitobacter sp. M57]|uniref:TadE/TadG family type IV pilus assembly protein n=1 Tax=unclassified Sulfitobacter TaxID=196795 RepID=UPI0023E2B915|nr:MULTISPECIES: TadE/TadG family type IV pilus assembly protein [unclassified Sulfitobacter]MDF3413138.1 pilus assembly protein [Sulfitobacter sp. KE5]MDF3421579.1 pilus assembly protein [Sulfitobacter sp. KE43]MDF3431687.1 pilus assembly protein [Sulfitobacter sp. KE42]MDF3457328.1 pilus assembly protein [Sulfitobacter sp. S74]MDF3461230.1 pilus assembly protein [Sulfitobacter sp. Ks18]
MRHPIRKLLRRFRRDEDGSAMVVEFALFVPLLFGVFLMAVEMGIYSMRQMYLDRGLDIAVRYIRLNTHRTFTHDDIKQMICANTGWLENCDETLRLEMTSVDPRAFARFDAEVDCVDTSLPVKPVRGFTLGDSNQVMMLRACVRFNPVYPTSGLGHEFEKDGTGRAKMVATAAFVQEP